MSDEFQRISIPPGGPIVYLDPTDISYISKDLTDSRYDDDEDEDEEGAVNGRDILGSLFIESSDTRKILERSFKYGLSPKERDIFELYYFEDKTQEQIGKLLNLSQRTVSYRISKGVQRIKYFLFIDGIDFYQLRSDLSLVLDDEYIDIIIGVITTSSQTTIGDLLSLSQSMVRWRFFKALDTIREKGTEDQTYREYAEIIDLVSSNFSIIKNKFKDF
jgi:DNA-directed RNA polymerase specialized sigma24 family protein